MNKVVESGAIKNIFSRVIDYHFFLEEVIPSDRMEFSFSFLKVR
jgi:hypothetical protein